MVRGGSRGAGRCPRSCEASPTPGFAVGVVGLPEAGGGPPALFGERRCRRSARPALGLQQAEEVGGAGASRLRFGSGPLKRATQLDVAARSRLVVEAVGERHQGAAEVPVLIEAVERGGRVVDQFDQAVPALGLLQAGEQLRQFGRRRDAGLRQLGRLAHDRVGFAEDRARRLRRSRRGSSAPPSSLPRTGSACGSRRSATGPPCRGRRRPARRRRRSPARLRIVRRNSRRKVGNFCSDASSAAPRSALACAAAPALAKKPATWAALAGQRAAGSRPSRWSAGPAGRAGRRGSPNRRSTSRRTGLARLTSDLEVFAAAGEAGAEFVEDEPEALRVGQRLDVVDQVRVDAGAVAAERQQVLACALLAVGDLSSAAAAAASPAPAAGSGGSRRTSRRSATAGGSGSWRRCGSPGSRDRRCSSR